MIFALQTPSIAAPADAAQIASGLHARALADAAERSKLTAWEQTYGFNGQAIPPSTSPAAKKRIQDEGQQIMGDTVRGDLKREAWLEAVIDRHGWPTASKVGAQGASDAGYLALHADQRHDFQRRCLELMSRLPKREINTKWFAFLTDRIRVAEGKPQIYGTQCDGTESPRQLNELIEDYARVDQRRAALGLQPLVVYFQGLQDGTEP